MIVVSFFAGCGGLDLGFEQAGFQVVWANEFEPAVRDTYLRNHPDTEFVLADLNTINPKDVPDCDGFIGGPPCQSWSVAGKRVDEVNKMAELGTRLAHVDGGVPNLLITIPALSEKYLGQLIYFFEKACGVSGYMLGVNPFNQPGVEAYKKNMFALLNKPGYEAESKAIQEKLKK